QVNRLDSWWWKEVQLHLMNDNSSFHPVHSRSREIGPQLLHHAKGRGQHDNVHLLAPYELKGDNIEQAIRNAASRQSR
ncbi:hypothetical protein KQ298_00870, partial [Synechococcus sp. CS-1330]|nr:hypothetical protein [Synechococcus sp. CS-1330]